MQSNKITTPKGGTAIIKEDRLLSYKPSTAYLEARDKYNQQREKLEERKIRQRAPTNPFADDARIK